MVSTSDLQSRGPKFCSNYYLDLFHVSHEFKSPAMLVNNQLACVQQVGILNNDYYIQFELFVSLVCLAPLVFVL